MPSAEQRFARHGAGTWRAVVSRFPADISAPAWLTMAQYHWLNDTAVTFRSIVIAPDTRRPGDKPGTVRSCCRLRRASIYAAAV